MPFLFENIIYYINDFFNNIILGNSKLKIKQNSVFEAQNSIISF